MSPGSLLSPRSGFRRCCRCAAPPPRPSPTRKRGAGARGRDARGAQRRGETSRRRAPGPAEPAGGAARGWARTAGGSPGRRCEARPRSRPVVSPIARVPRPASRRGPAGRAPTARGSLRLAGRASGLVRRAGPWPRLGREARKVRLKVRARREGSGGTCGGRALNAAPRARLLDLGGSRAGKHLQDLPPVCLSQVTGGPQFWKSLVRRTSCPSSL